MIFTRTQAISTVAVVILVIGIGIIWKVQQVDKSLSVIYLTTGEVYVGTLATFPRLSLSGDSYQFQMVPSQQGGSADSTRLIPLSDAPWAPKRLYLNRGQVVLYGPLSEESLIFKALLEKSATTTTQ